MFASITLVLFPLRYGKSQSFQLLRYCHSVMIVVAMSIVIFNISNLRTPSRYKLHLSVHQRYENDVRMTGVLPSSCIHTSEAPIPQRLHVLRTDVGRRFHHNVPQPPRKVPHSVTLLFGT
jgi:hypothetical protein